jgi:hypothetical protein
MTSQAKRAVAAMMIAGGIVTCVGFLIVGRLAPTTFAPVAWIAVLGITAIDFVIAYWLLRTSKS